MPNHVKILIVVSSAGIDPWLSLENSSQRKFLLQLESENVSCIWLRPSLLENVWQRALGRLDRGRRWLLGRPNRLARWLRILEWRHGPLIPGLVKVGRRMAEVEINSPSFCELEQNVVTYDFPPSAWLVTTRIGPQMEYCLDNYDFTHMLRTTSTSLVDRAQLLHASSELGFKKVYAGQVIEYLNGLKFVRGSSMLLSRDMVSAIVSNRNRLRLDQYDDVAVGRLVEDMKLTSPVNINETSAKIFLESENHVDQGNRRSVVIRCKPDNWDQTAPPAVELMNEVGNILVRNL